MFNVPQSPGSWYLNMALLARAGGNSFQFTNNCFYKLSLNWTKLRLNKRSPCTLTRCKHSTTNVIPFSTGLSSPNDKKKKYIVYDDSMSQRRDQAQRSILVQVQSEQSSYELYDFCSKVSKIQEMQHYTINGSVHFVLIEFATLSDLNAIDSVSTYNNAQQHMPVVSPMLWFRATTKSNKKETFSKNIPMTVTNGTAFPNSEAVNDLLFQAESISEQMTILCDSTKLNDTDTRLRFLTARQIETSLSGIFANISVLPFGSSVNGFGKHGCDLDLVLKLHTDTMDNLKCRLVYHTKSGGSNDRFQAQKVMEIISDIMQQFLPGITSIRRILKARVPIIKYNQTLTGLECDLSMTNTIGIYMSELLYLYGELDWRVKPLTFTIKMWANRVQLTNSTPGNWISNFSLTLLILFFLQRKQILPNLQQLVKLANKNDIRIADSCVDCTFLRDISRLPKSNVQNNETLEELLMNFFTYYSSFDFSTKAISLNVGTAVAKPDNSSVFIYNPLEPGLNVTKNMNIQETERLKIEMRNAAWLLDSAADNESKDWGLLSLFNQKVQQSGSAGVPHKLKLIEFSTLFKKPPIVDNVSLNNSKGTLSMSVSASLMNNRSSVSKNVERQGTRKTEKRNSRKQESGR